MNSKVRMPGSAKTLDPRYFVLIRPLPIPTQKGAKVQVRSSTIYNCWESTREQVFWENYHRRHQQLTQHGYWTPSWKPYQELGEILYLEPKKLTLHYLGQMPQEPIKEEVSAVQEEVLKKADAVTIAKISLRPKSTTQERLKKPPPFKQIEKDLKSLNKDLTHTSFFLTEGPLLRKKAKKKKKAIIQPFIPVYNSLLVPQPPASHAEPLFRQLCALHWLLEALTLEPNCSLKPVLTCWNPKDPGGNKSTFKKINKDKAARYRWEHFIMDTKKSCQKAPRSQLSRKTNKKTSISGSRFSGLSSPYSRTPLGSISSLVPSSEDNTNVSTAPIDVTKEYEDCESVQSRQTREDEEPVSHYLQKLLQTIYEDVAKNFSSEDIVKKTRLHSSPAVYQRNERTSLTALKDQESILGQRPKSSLPVTLKDDRVNPTSFKYQESLISLDQRPKSSLSVTVREDKTTTATFKEEESTKHIKRPKSSHASYFIQSKYNLCAEMRQKFSAVAEEAAFCLHDNLEILERRREEKSSQKYQSLKNITYFERDLERMRQCGLRTEREHDEDECNWFSSLLSRIPDAVKNDSHTQRILKKLEKFGRNPDVRIRPNTFLKVLSELRVWELCSPDICAAVEVTSPSVRVLIQGRWAGLCVKISFRCQKRITKRGFRLESESP
ncbi:coiled-coil domain-containing protein 60 isoform X6 [Lepidochelys kempii]|uniref:coiled-coil domain-containing protein 60 isoform X6 n=1 Tax=Lepidochelys kempii TaxID=8472 RepID=UPI003C6F2126